MQRKFWQVLERFKTFANIMQQRYLSFEIIHFKPLMHATALQSDHAITAEQKQAALEAILHSHTFARTDQLKSFLKYICEMELAGRGHELTEYLIGVEALGRPVNYSPGDDSAVRNRAFALRKKLQEYYELEQPTAPVRIELNKGSYCPHFLSAPAAAQPKGLALAAPPPVVESLVSLPIVKEESLAVVPQTPSVKRNWLMGFVAGAVLTALTAGVLYWFTDLRSTTAPQTSALAPIIAEAWGPLLTHNAEVLVCVANPPSLSVHPDSISGSPFATFNDPNARRLPIELLDWIRERYPTINGQQHLTLTTNGTYWGDALGALTAYKTLVAAGTAPRLFPEMVLSMPALRQRNVVLLGAAEYSPAIAHFLAKCPLTANFLNGIAATGKPQEPLYQIKRNQSKRMTQVYGLITVLPSDSSVDQNHRTIIFSGINSAGTQAAAEFFTSPENLQVLKRQFAKDGHRTFPSAYQVVVRVETDDNILLNYHYETYRLVPLPASH